jgi:hypothetical protein
MFKKEPKRWDKDKLLDMAYQAQLFEQPVVKEFFDQNEYQLWQRWTSEPSPEEREQLYLQAQGLSAFRTFIEHTIRDGKMAAQDLEEENQAIQKNNRQ